MPALALLSIPIPGLGQWARGHRWRGGALFFSVLTAWLIALWYGHPAWLIFPATLWLWTVWDAIKLPPYQPQVIARGAPAWIAVVLWLVLAYGVGIQVTGFRPLALFTQAGRAVVLLRPMLRPDFFAPGSFNLSVNGQYIVQGIAETLALALLATSVGALLGLPLGFLAARNLMGTNAITRLIYVLVRAFLNVTRSIESLIMAIVFVTIVGLGPFPGMLALVAHTAAALGKLFSEVIEGIDPGPIEAIRATGATWLQIVRYGVLPQVLPPFAALTIYRWDINVRSSTIIGFVGGSGIGFYLYQWITNSDFRAVSASFIIIAIVVVVMDYLSAKIRERLI